MPSFSDALNRSSETIKRPPPLPIGHYVFRVVKQPDPPETMDTKVGKMEKLTIPLACVSATDDVDPEELESFGSVAGAPSRIDFLFSNEDENKFEQTMFRFKNFCGHAGLDIDSGTMGEWLSQLPNTQFVAEIKHRLDPNDSAIVYSEIGRTAPIE